MTRASGGLFVLLAGLILVRAASAGEKPLLHVCFLLSEPAYVVEFSKQEKAELDRKAASSLARRLASRLAFLDALPMDIRDCKTEDDDVWLLRVELNRKDQNAQGDLQEVGFHLQLQGKDTDDSKKVYWVFRDKTKMFNVEYKVPVFLRQISEALDKADFDHLVHELLSQLPVSTDATLFKDDIFGSVGWKLTQHTHEDLCMNEASILVVRGEFRGSTTSKVKNVYTKVTRQAGNTWRSRNIHSEVSDHRNDEQFRRALIDRFTDANIEILAVSVDKYVQLRQCGSASPEKAGL